MLTGLPFLFIFNLFLVHFLVFLNPRKFLGFLHFKVTFVHQKNDLTNKLSA